MAQFDAPSDATPVAPQSAAHARSSRSASDSPSKLSSADASASSESQVGSSREVQSEASDRFVERTILDDRAIRRALMRIAHEIVESTDQPERLYLVAIPNGGVPLGRILIENLESLTGLTPPLGIMDTTLYRDDLSTRDSRPMLRKTVMPSSVDDRIVVLVEDVVNTGRTIRAGMDALMDFGRPSHVRVVALVDRGHRELPIKIDFVGKNIPTQPNEKVIFRAEALAHDPGESASSSKAEGVPSFGRLELIVRGEKG